MVDVNELRAQRAAVLQHDFPLGDLLSYVVSITCPLSTSGSGTRNAPSTGIRVPDPAPASEAQPKENGDVQREYTHTEDNTAKTDSN
jgi:hypothetical protein